MAKTKKATPSPVDEKVYDVETTYKNLTDDSSIDIKIRSSISLVEMCACVNNIVDGIINDSSYTPYFYDVSLYGNLLEVFSDFDVSVGFEKINELVYKTNIVQVLEKNISYDQLETIIKSVDELSELKKQKLATNSEIDSTFTGLLNDFRSLLAKADNFLNLDPDVLGKVVNNLAGMEGISQKDLIDAIVDKSGVAKGKGGRKATKGKTKDNVVELPIPLQQTFQDGEINDTEVTE